MFDKKTLHTISEVLAESNHLDAKRVFKIVDDTLTKEYGL